MFRYTYSTYCPICDKKNVIHTDKELFWMKCKKCGHHLVVYLLNN